MTVKLKGNLYVGPVNIFLIFTLDTLYKIDRHEFSLKKNLYFLYDLNVWKVVENTNTFS